MKCVKVLLCFLVATMVISCSKKDEPVVPTDPKVEIATAYYFTGVVHEGDTHLASVDVLLNGVKKATTDKDGAYAFSVENKGAFDITFQKTGYIPQTLTRDNSSIADQQSVIVNVRMTKTAAAVVATGDVQVVTSKTLASGVELSVGLDLPKGAVSKGTSMSLTPYTPTANGATPTLIGVDIQPKGQQFTSATLKLKGSCPAGISYSKLIVTDLSSKSKAVVTQPIYNPATNEYSIVINSFGNYLVNADVPVTISQPETGTQLFQSFAKADACGSNQMIEIPLVVTERSGYVYDKPISELVKTAFPTLTLLDQNTIAKSLTSKVEGLLGPTGIETFEVNKGTVKVYPNTILQYQSYPVDRYITASFEFLDAQKNTVVIPVKVKQAVGTSPKITAVSCENHSGGGSN